MASVLFLLAAALVLGAPTAEATTTVEPAGEAAAHDHAAPSGRGGHDAAEGPVLAPEAHESVNAGPGCAPGAPLRLYRVAAIAVEVTLNRYLDHDPQGRMFVLDSQLGRVRSEEDANAAARTRGSEPEVTIGLQGDAIQPLTLRVRPGECLRIRLTNRLPAGETASLHLHSSRMVVARGGGPATSSNPRAMAAPGDVVTYEWAVPGDEPEGARYLHSHGRARFQTSRGLFGAVIVEPPDSTWVDPRTGRVATGWDAVIRTPRASETFREYALYYHEIGDETYQIKDRTGAFVPVVDPLLGAYRPGTRALNYRSEPFSNRMQLQRARTGRFDESLAYSSYAFGDPATPLMRAHLGERVKQRVVHAGSEVFHVHHVHGGSIRWRRQAAEPSSQRSGLDKRPPLLARGAERVDSQSLGPSEVFDVVPDCGAGGCQQSVGDFLYHCHVAHHYFAGMWGLWRVYNTAQVGSVQTDTMPALVPLAAVRSRVRPAVPASSLASRPELEAALARQLPPPGVPASGDASVFDWTVGPTSEGGAATYLSEPEATDSWPGYSSTSPGLRGELLVDSRTNRLAYPWLRPHLGKRPPFAPGHGPAPYLDPPADPSKVPRPGASGPASTCPAGTRLRSMVVDVVKTSVPLSPSAGIVDNKGELFVLAEEKEKLRADPSRRIPLAVRANARRDCVDVLLRSEMEDDAANHGLAKVSAHVHFVQFDVQASDGVDAGFNFEQTIRPWTIEGTRLSAGASAGATTVQVADGRRLAVGALVGIGMDRADGTEIRAVVSATRTTLTIDRPLDQAHGAGEGVSTEFVRYRWFPDVQFGTAYFHDHVNALASWTHGLFGALVAEPPDATWHHPRTGEELASGPVADVHTSARVSADVVGSFREMVMFLQDQNPLTSSGRSSGSSINLRVSPLGRRRGDPALKFSSSTHGDPDTPVLEAHLGDPLVFRTLVAGTNDVHSWHLDGHWFRTEPQSRSSPKTNTVAVGISERYDLVVPAAGGPQRRPGDYLYYGGRLFKLREGSWGLVRVRAGSPGSPPVAGELRPLPGRPAVAPSPARTVCPAGASPRPFHVRAVDDPRLPMMGGAPGKRYELVAPLPPSRPEPLVLHARVGDCIRVRLDNATTGGPVSFHADMLAADPASSAGVGAGYEPRQAAEVGSSRTYELYASPEVGETVALVRDWGDVDRNPALGLYGAVVVGPRGARFTDPVTGTEVLSGVAVDVHPPDAPSYRDLSLFFQDEDAALGTHRMPYASAAGGVVGLNYGRGTATEPATVLQAGAGDPVRLHLISPSSEQAQVVTVDDHRWAIEPRPDAPVVSSTALVALEARTVIPHGGAGGGVAGDYVIANARLAYQEAGQWGILRVVPPCARAVSGIRALPGTCEDVRVDRGRVGLVWGGLGLLGLTAVALDRRRRRDLSSRA